MRTKEQVIAEFEAYKESIAITIEEPIDEIEEVMEVDYEVLSED